MVQSIIIRILGKKIVGIVPVWWPFSILLTMDYKLLDEENNNNDNLLIFIFLLSLGFFCFYHMTSFFISFHGQIFTWNTKILFSKL